MKMIEFVGPTSLHGKLLSTPQPTLSSFPSRTLNYMYAKMTAFPIREGYCGEKVFVFAKEVDTQPEL